MRTEAIVLATVAALVATTRPAHADERGRWVAIVDGEASVIGEAFGVRGEALWRIAGAHHLRAAVGVLTGPELTFVPISLGYRAVWRSDRTVQPFAGVGWENQHILISDAPAIHRWAVVYVEGGCGFGVRPHLSLGVATSVDFAFVTDLGPGLQLRGFAAWRF